MRFSTLFTTAFLAVSSVSAMPGLTTSLVTRSWIDDLDAGDKYGAPIPPWTEGCKPGWYHGNNPQAYPGIPWLSGFICQILHFFPHLLQCPPSKPLNGYRVTFTNLTGAIQSSDYLTYGLVDTVANCESMCDSVAGCVFVNTYHDVNGKGGSTQLTCSLFSSCLPASDATNMGGQTQPDGSVDYITESAGYCKA